MVDLETMGKGSTAAIIAIGAVKFNGKGLGEEFYAIVDLESSVKNGMVIEPDTVMWWMKQSDAARGEFAKGTESLFTALQGFSKFVGDHKTAKVWGNGASFDNVILDNAYQLNNLDTPWRFYNNMCYRTIKNLLGQSIEIERTGEHHNALDDAKSQAEHLVRMLAALKGG
jgi:exodeoxyribonuclease VIII